MYANKIKEFVQLAIKNKDIFDYDIKIQGKTGRGDGYLGNVAFVTVSGKTKTSEKKSLEMVIKFPTQSDLLRNQVPIKLLFQKEIQIYDEIIPAFNLLQQNKGIDDDLLNFLPNCYFTQKTEGHELLILENLKPKGYDVWNRKVPMPYEHIRAVLQAFGKWHAFSLALKQERPEIFEKFVEGNHNMWPYYARQVGLLDIFFKYFEEAKYACLGSNEIDFKVLQFSKDDVEEIFEDSFFEDTDDKVILHGDCWTSNFLFRLKEDRKKSVDVCIIDWQCTGLASPIMDLSCFIYTCVDTETYKDVRELLKIYHDSLSECLDCLVNEVDEMFSFNKLIKHWKQFSRYGLLLGGIFLLKFSLCDADEAPDFTETAEQGKEFLENFNFDIKNKGAYHTRVKSNLLHYIRNLKQ